MRRIIESLTPDDHIYWRWVGSMFALYVVLMITAAGVFVRHESSKKLAQEAAQTVAIDARLRSIVPTSVPAQNPARRFAESY